MHHLDKVLFSRLDPKEGEEGRVVAAAPLLGGGGLQGPCGSRGTGGFSLRIEAPEKKIDPKLTPKKWVGQSWD